MSDISELAGIISENLESAELMYPDRTNTFTMRVRLFGIDGEISVVSCEDKHTGILVVANAAPRYVIQLGVFPTMVELVEEMQTIHLHKGKLETLRNLKKNEIIEKVFSFGKYGGMDIQERIEKNMTSLDLKDAKLSKRVLEQQDDSEEEEKKEETTSPNKKRKILLE